MKNMEKRRLRKNQEMILNDRRNRMIKLFCKTENKLNFIQIKKLMIYE